MSFSVEPVLQIPTILGEGPFWSAEEQALYWLDIFKPTLNRFSPQTGDNEAIALPEPIYAAVMYHTDFKNGTIYAYDFCAERGTITNRRPFIVLPESDGFPDGMTVDAQGHLWVAHWDGWCVTRHDSSGDEIQRLAFPVPRPTCPAFGGADLSVLYVTSATMHLSRDQLAQAPLSGALFAVGTDSCGLPEPHFSG